MFMKKLIIFEISKNSLPQSTHYEKHCSIYQLNKWLNLLHQIKLQTSFHKLLKGERASRNGVPH